MMEICFKHLYEPGDRVFLIGYNNEIYVRKIYSVYASYRSGYMHDYGGVHEPSDSVKLSYALFEPVGDKCDKDRTYKEEDLYPTIDDAYAVVKCRIESQYLKLKSYLEDNSGIEETS